MKLSFFGAAKLVTGSNYLLETNNHKILIDCGLFQGSKAIKAKNYEEFPYKPSEIDFLLLTHAHIDHSGRIPLLYKKGFKGEVICTNATKGLCQIMLPDSGHIQEMNVKYKNRKRTRAGLELLSPLYTIEDAYSCLNKFTGVQYNSTIKLTDSITLRYRDAGHILGSASIEVWVEENNKQTKLIFSGDLGKDNTPIINDPYLFKECDFLLMESTYGNKYHEFKSNSTERMFQVIEETLSKGGSVIIPSFSVGRTQEMIYAFNKIETIKEKWQKIKNVSVYVDSPLAISATEVFKDNIESFDDEAKQYILNGDNPLDFDNLIFTRSTEESKSINYNKNPKIIISASGMCDAGRIKHHLKHHLWEKENTILFVGYQAHGTLGRLLVDGAEKVKIFGETINVKARIEMIDGFSGHGDIENLDKFLGSFTKKPSIVFLVHGEIDQLNGFSKRINEKFNMKTIIPDIGECYEIQSVSDKKTIINVDRTITDNTYKRLELLNYVAKLKEEISDITELISYDVINKLDEDEISKTIDYYEKIDDNISDLITLVEESKNE